MEKKTLVLLFDSNVVLKEIKTYKIFAHIRGILWIIKPPFLNTHKYLITD